MDFKQDSPLMQKHSGIKSYVWLFTGLFIFYLILSPFVTLGGTSGQPAFATDPYDGDGSVRLVMGAVLLFLFAVFIIMILWRRMTISRLLLFIIFAGIILRFGYMLYTPFYIRGHDVGRLNSYGHLSYIYHLFSLQGLPESNLGQFYHPPFAHIASAAIAKVYAILTGESDLDTIIQSARLIPCFASCGLLIITNRLFDEFSFSKTAKTMALTVVAFHPTFIVLSASINNDMLMIFFFMTAFLYTVRWYKNPSYKNILLLALSIGSAMSTKFSGSLIAVFTAAVFLIVLMRKIREKSAVGVIYQFSAFAVICFPLGLWYHIRNLKLFGQALGHVAQMGRDSALYVGDIPAAERFLAFSLPDMLRNPYCNPFEDFRLWEYTVKCALFGEFTYSSKHDIIAVILIVTSLILIVLSLGATVWFLIFERKKQRLAVLSLISIWALLMLSFVFFNIKYPFGCTMDFRYIVPTVITGAAFLGLLSDKLQTVRAGRLLFVLFAVIIAVFCVFSAGFYII